MYGTSNHTGLAVAAVAAESSSSLGHDPHSGEVSIVAAAVTKHHACEVLSVNGFLFFSLSSFVHRRNRQLDPGIN